MIDEFISCVLIIQRKFDGCKIILDTVVDSEKNVNLELSIETDISRVLFDEIRKSIYRIIRMSVFKDVANSLIIRMVSK